MGSKTSKHTVVANSCLHDIYVSCKGGLSKHNEYNVRVKKDSLKFAKRKVVETEDGRSNTIKIQHRQYSEFYPKSKKRVYLTIVYYDEKYNMITLCSSHEIPKNRNVVVDSSGGVKLTKGRSYWVDTDGIDHQVVTTNLEEYQEDVRRQELEHQREVAKIMAEHEQRLKNVNIDNEERMEEAKRYMKRKKSNIRKRHGVPRNIIT